MTHLTTLRTAFLERVDAMPPMQRHTAARVAQQIQERDRLAYLLAIVTGAIEPDEVDIDTPPVSDWADQRNSRPFPY